MAQFGYPISDVTNEWSCGGWADLDDASPGSDTDHAYTADNPSADVLECALTASLGDPISDAGHIMRWRHVLIDGGVVASSAGTGCDLTTQLIQTTTVIGGKSAVALDTVTAWAADTYTLSAGEADAITDYTDLRIRWTADGGGGSPANRRGAGVSWFELELPNIDNTRAAHVTAFELEAENAARQAHVTAFELEAENAAGNPPTVGATITTDVTDSGGENPTWNTISHTVDAGTNLLLVFINIGFNADRDPTSVTWDGQSLTQVDEIVDGTNTRTQIWRRYNPNIASDNISIVWSSSSGRMSMTAINIAGADVDGTPLGTPVQNNATSTNPNVDVSSATDELVIATTTIRNANGNTLSEDIGTEHSQITHADQFGGQASVVTQAGAGTVNFDWTSNNSAEWTAIGVAILPEPAGAGGRWRQPTIFARAVMRASNF